MPSDWAFELHKKCKRIEANVIARPLSRSIEVRLTVVQGISESTTPDIAAPVD